MGAKSEACFDWILDQTGGLYYIPPVCAVCGHNNSNSNPQRKNWLDEQPEQLVLCPDCGQRFNQAYTNGGTPAIS